MVDDEPVSPKAGEGIIDLERQRATELLEFMTTLPDVRQRAVCDEVFSPIGQIELQNAFDEAIREKTSDPTVQTRFGLFPRDTDPVEHSVFALIAAAAEQKHANELSEDNSNREGHLAEAARLRQLAKHILDEHDQEQA